ncbi:SWIM zinc finger family protein [Actinomadura rubteroloni]|uniref:SWIM zinc finger family protein n=1 Tax=Actinomadura rubteroloni TaxID=1926885 RepID=UPI00196B9F8A|nr:SWIM zinc finger family protein [Actinomadura rubteroloni]
MDERRERRERRVAAGLDDLDRWLRDRVARGLAAEDAGQFDEPARRLVDAQAGALAGQVRGLSSVPHGPERPGALLAEYALLRLLVHAHRRPDLPAPLRATVRSRIGFTVPREDVLSDGERVRDRWCVVGVRDSAQEQLTTRRAWLRGRGGRSALVLSFAPPGRPLDDSLTAGTELDAELAFFPGAAPLRALVAERHGEPVPAVPDGTTIAGFLTEHAAALAADPWTDRWPAVLADVRLARPADDGLAAMDAAGDVLPLRTPDPWPLLAVSGGEPVTLAGEWTPRGLHPLAAWHPTEGPVIL